MQSDPRDDYDSPWKLILSRHLREALEHLFPEAAADIDWSAGITPHDTELQAIRPDADSGRRYVDQLVSVRLLDGSETLVFIHVEVQAGKVRDFARRMFMYNSRLMHLHDESVVSFAILADDDLDWHPRAFATGRWGCQLDFQFPAVKLAALPPDPPARRLFSHVLAAYATARATRKDPATRLRLKVSLVKGMLDQGFGREEVRDIYTFIDWVLRLPLDLEPHFHDHIRRYEEERAMEYVTTAERIGIEKGLLQGLEQGLEQGREQGLEQGRETVRRLLQRQLIRKFGPLPAEAEARLNGASLTQMEAWADRIVHAAHLDEVLA